MACTVDGAGVGASGGSAGGGGGSGGGGGVRNGTGRSVTWGSPFAVAAISMPRPRPRPRPGIAEAGVSVAKMAEGAAGGWGAATGAEARVAEASLSLFRAVTGLSASSLTRRFLLGMTMPSADFRFPFNLMTIRSPSRSTSTGWSSGSSKPSSLSRTANVGSRPQRLRTAVLTSDMFR